MNESQNKCSISIHSGLLTEKYQFSSKSPKNIGQSLFLIFRLAINIPYRIFRKKNYPHLFESKVLQIHSFWTEQLILFRLWYQHSASFFHRIWLCWTPEALLGKDYFSFVFQLLKDNLFKKWISKLVGGKGICISFKSYYNNRFGFM